jgi:chromosome partitioning protein
MDAPTYSAKQAASVLRLPLRTLHSALKQEKYSGVDLWAVRHTLKHFPRPLGHRRQLFLNFKGGTGKTALSTSYAWRMAELGYHVLLVDLDSQGHATKCLGFEGEDFEKTLLNVLVRKAPMDEVIQHTPMPNLDFVPSNLTMSTVDLALMPMSAREFKLKNALKEVSQRYDTVVFDAPPSFGLLNLNALMAADDLFVPVLADFLSFHGLKLLFETVQSLEEDLAHVLDHVFIVVNAFNQTFKLAKEALEALKTHYPEYMLTAMVRQCTTFAQASSEGVPVFLAGRDSKGATDIDAMVTEVLARIEAAHKRTTGSGRDAQKAG